MVIDSDTCTYVKINVVWTTWFSDYAGRSLHVQDFPNPLWSSWEDTIVRSKTCIFLSLIKNVHYENILYACTDYLL